MAGRFDRGPRDPFLINTVPVYWSLATWMVGIGFLLMVAPPDWFGPSWSYFTHHGLPIIPAGGFGMGVVCVILGGLQMLVLWRRGSKKHRQLSILFLLGGFVYWTAGLILGAEGLSGHQGLMEAPFMLYVAVHKFAHSAALATHVRQQKTLREAGDGAVDP